MTEKLNELRTLDFNKAYEKLLELLDIQYNNGVEDSITNVKRTMVIIECGNDVDIKVISEELKKLKR